MARIAYWRGQEVMARIGAALEENAEAAMDDVVREAKSRVPVGTVSRPGTWTRPGFVSFTATRGRNKGQTLSFGGQSVWTGRTPGDLRATIRRVSMAGSGNIRVYAGTHKINWARFVELGSPTYAPHPFLRPAFYAVKSRLLRRLKGETGTVPRTEIPTRIGMNPQTGLVSYIY